MAELLVSVRSVCEAEAAMVGGAAIIDVKEPTHGALGRAAETTIAAVVAHVARRLPLSAALGECLQADLSFDARGLDYVKWGLAGCGNLPDWPALANKAAIGLVANCQPVAVAYADWRRAEAPEPDAVIAFARSSDWRVVLFDTWGKDGRTLLDWLSTAEIARLVCQARAGGLRVALAGALDVPEIQRLRSIEPDWFAVRSAACAGGLRQAKVCPERVRRLVQLLEA